MEIVWLLLGFAIGGVVAGVVAYVVVDRRTRQALTTANTEAALAVARADQSQAALAEAAKTAAAVRQELTAEQQARAGLVARLEAATENHARQTDMSSAALGEVNALRQQLATLQQDRATLEAKLDAERKAIAEQREQITDTAKKLNESFAALSQDALKHNREAFIAIAEEKFKTLQTAATGALDQKKSEMSELIQPMRQTLDEYRLKLDAIETTRTQAYVDIKEHLAAVTSTQLNLSVETKQLVTALRRPQGRGRWGELTLRRLFELAGMADRVTFEEQVQVDGGRLRPDCIVQLPEGRQVIVDSKCVLDAFLDSTNCADELLRKECLVRHAEQVRSRVRDLSNKAYWESLPSATDYVVLFLPGEAFLYAAVDQDPMLIENAMNNRVIVASPTTLLGLLRVIEHGWKHKAIEENATQIKDVGGKLYQRVVKVADHLDKLGRAITGVTGAYNDTVGSLEKNVLSAAREMAKLGVPTKQADVPLIDETSGDVRSLRASAWKVLPKPAVEADETALATTDG